MDSIEEQQFLFPNKDKSKESKVDKKMNIKAKVGKLYAGFKERYNEFLEDDQVQDFLQKTTEILKQNPLLTCCLFAILVGIALPVTFFVLFVIANIAFVIAGFIILEVTIFIIGATVVICSVFFVLSTVAVICLSILSFYLIFYYLITLMKKRKVK